MILPPAIILGAQILASQMPGAHLIVPVADSVPTLNVDQVCQGIAQQGGVTFHDSAVGEEKQNCVDSEKGIRDQLAKEWSSFAPTDKIACTNESTTGGESSYTELLTCLEMARDVRAMNTSEKSGDTQAQPVRAKPKP
jgi:hypothetical protein